MNGVCGGQLSEDTPTPVSGKSNPILYPTGRTNPGGGAVFVGGKSRGSCPTGVGGCPVGAIVWGGNGGGGAVFRGGTVLVRERVLNLLAKSYKRERRRRGVKVVRKRMAFPLLNRQICRQQNSPDSGIFFICEELYCFPKKNEMTIVT